MKRNTAATTARSSAMEIHQGVVERIDEDGVPVVRVGFEGAARVKSAARRLGLQVGDEVLLARGSSSSFILARIPCSGETGSTGEGDEIVTALGDVILRAPNGRIVLEAGSEVEIRTKQTTLQSSSLDVTAARASLHFGEATVLADALRTVADEVVTHVGRWELRARRIVEDADVATLTHRLVHHTVDRMRTVAHDALHFFAKRTSVVSEEDTSVDGKRVLLG